MGNTENSYESYNVKNDYYDHCKVYFDNAATTPVNMRVAEDIMYALGIYYNPSSIYKNGMDVKKMIEEARENVRKYLHADEEDLIIFTGSGTEANNIAIQGFFNSHIDATDFLCPPTEHPSVRGIADHYEDENLFRVHWLKNDYVKGCLDLDNLDVLLDEIRQQWSKSSGEMLVSCMYGNNETGVINDIKKICEIAHSKCEVYVHTDATQVVGHLDKINVKELGVDMLSFSGHKLGLPKGVGVLYIRKGLEIEGVMFGGNQEYGLRPGTENFPYIYALGNRFKDLERIGFYGKYYFDEKANELPWVVEKNVRDSFEEALLNDKDILKRCPKIRVNYKDCDRLPNISSMTFTGYDGKKIQTLLGDKGICVSVGSACSNYESKPSRTLLNLGFSASDAESTVRFSFNDLNRRSQIDTVVRELGSFLRLLDRNK